jgi:uncharacterized protein
VTGRPVSRRSVLRAALAAALAGAPAAACAGAAEPIRVAVGDSGGLSPAFGDLLAEALTRRGSPAVAVPTEGSGTDLDMVLAGHCTAGLAVADLVRARADGELRALGRVYENYVQMVVVDSRFQRLTDFRGRRVSVGSPGSGAALMGRRLLAAAEVDAEVTYLPRTEAIAALGTGAVDACLWTGEVAASAVDPLSPLRLVDLAEPAATVCTQFATVYRPALIPAGVYRSVRPVATIAVPSLLVARADAPEQAVAEIVSLLLEEADTLVPPQTLGEQSLRATELVDTCLVPMHPTAVRTYRGHR